MEEPLPTINEVLSAFLGNEINQSTGVRRKRIELVDDLLREYLEVESDAFLSQYGKTLLAAEREFNADDAACRTLRADTLLFALRRFVEPPYLQSDPLLQRMQLRIVEGLADRLVHVDLVGYDTACDRWDVSRALNAAKWELNRERRENARARRVERQREEVRKYLEEWRSPRRASAGESQENQMI